MEYRRELDGLRAIAVVPVILSHTGLTAFAGGFIGVDVFFVISGYLITSIIVGEQAAGRFSLLLFYERRARRILPALFIVLLFSVVACWHWLLPLDLVSFSGSLVATCAFASNFFFWWHTGYFDAASELKPLLHTWTLAVEEQFYVLFPLILMPLSRLRRRHTGIFLSLLGLMSFGVAEWALLRYPAGAFYLLPTRAWELLVGALIAVINPSRKQLLHGSPLGRLVAGSADTLGLVLIAVAIFGLDKHTPFPGHNALAPTVGAALVIVFCHPTTTAGKFLSHKLPVTIGLVSYSSYLWHQPLFALAKYRSIALSTASLLALSMLSLALGFLSWRYIERPFRDKARVGRGFILVFAVVGTLSFAFAGRAGVRSNGFPDRVPPGHLPADYFAFAVPEPKVVLDADHHLCVSETASMCRVLNRPEAATAAPRVLLVGDSHSADFTNPFRVYAKNIQAEAWQMSVGGCGFLASQSSIHNGECGRARSLLERAAADLRFDRIILIGNYAEYGHRQTSDVRRADIRSFSDLVVNLLKSGAEVIAFSPRLRLSALPMHAALSNQLASVRTLPMAESTRDWRTAFSELAMNRRFQVFEQTAMLLHLGCGSLACFDGHSPEGRPLLRDRGHLTDYGARLLFDRFVAAHP